MSLWNTAKRALQWVYLGRAVKTLHSADNEYERLKAKQALAALFADARGITMKVGQLFAGTEGDTPLQPLVSGIEPLPLQQVQPILEQALGKSVTEVFQRLDEAVAAASLGQVHFAVLRSGAEVALKIRYPHIVEAVDAELRLLGLMPGVGPVSRWGFDLESYKHSLRDNMQRELDYRSEAMRQAHFAEVVRLAGLKVPAVHLPLCHEQVLVQERAQGNLLDVARHGLAADRHAWASTLMQTLFYSLFVAGEVHADPHPGNVFYGYDAQGKPRVTLLDFGCTVTVAETRRIALLQLIVACRERRDIKPLDCFAAMGFESQKLAMISGALPALCQALFRPFLVDHAFDTEQWALGSAVADLLGEYRWWFRSAGPADLFLLLRAFQGLIQHLQQLHSPLPWWSVLQETLGQERLQQARSYVLPSVALDEAVPVLSFAQQATSLCVQVLEDTVQRVSLRMPAEAVLQLEQLIPPDVLNNIQRAGIIDLQRLGVELRSKGITPQTVFEFSEAGKQYRVWLE